MSRALLFVPLLLVLSARVPAAAPPAQPTPSQIARWVEELGDEEFEKRQAASARLRGAGESAEAALEKAADSPDAEVKRRARAILNDFHRGIYPDTPAEVVELIRKYETSTSQEKAAVIRKLLAAGPTGCRALVKLVRGEKDAVTRKEVFAEVFAGIARALPALIEAGNLAALEGVLELAVQGDVKDGVAHYAAYHLVRGTLPRQIAAFERQAKGKVVAKAEYEVLAFLYRAGGDLARAVKAAKEAERTEWVGALLFEMADWKALNEKPALIESTHRTQQFGYRAAFARLCGDEKTYLAVIKEIIELAQPVAEAKGNVLPHAKALLINGRADDALALLKKGGARDRLVYDVLAARMQVKEAFALVEEARKAESADLPALELSQARMFHQLGEKEKALAIVKKYTQKIAKDTEAGWFAELVETELTLGRRDQAFEVAAKVLSLVNDPATSARLFDKLFGENAEEAAALWVLLRRPPVKLEHAQAMARLRLLLAGKGNKEDVERLITAAKNVPPNTRPEQEADHWHAAGEAAVRGKQDEQAAECFRKAGTLRATLRLGDIEASKKQWLKASILYLQAYRLGLKRAETEARVDSYRENQPALALYLYGHALAEAGMEGGKRRMEQAHLLPLGDSGLRYELMRDLLRRGHKKASQREQEYLRRLGEPLLLEPGAYTGEGFRAAALDAAARNDWLKAADAYEQSFLRVLQPELNFARALAYVTVPSYIFRLRALGLIKAGKLDEARHEATRSRATLPGNVDLASQLVPLLEARGRKKDADDFYAATRAPYDALVRDYPKAAWVHNQLAWLSATCRRDLEKGRANAKRAVELVPDNAGYHDTLAEVLFQMGKKDEAVAAQKKAVALDPKRVYFQKQLKRIEAGDPRAPRPAEDE